VSLRARPAPDVALRVRRGHLRAGAGCRVQSAGWAGAGARLVRLADGGQSASASRSFTAKTPAQQACRNCAAAVKRRVTAIKNSAIAAFVVVSAVSIAACGTSTNTHFVHSENISKSTFKGTSPFIPDSGVLACDSSKGNAVTFTPTGSTTTYAENGPAAGWAAREGWEPNDRHIWLTADGRQDDTPNMPRVYGGDVIQEGLKLCGDATSATAAASSTTPSSSPHPTTGGPSGLGPANELCQVQGDNGGTYLLWLTSAVHDLSQCDNGTPLQGGIGELFDNPEHGPNVDRRCIYNPTNDPTVQAIVGVYSSSRDIDRAAAREVCDEHHGSNS